MKKIDIEKVIQSRGLDKREVADHLFPGIKHPDLALRRVILGESNLDSDQISKLAGISGCTVLELFEGQFKKTGRDGKIIFDHEDYKAVLYIEDMRTEVYHKGSLFHEEVFHSKAIPLSEYLNQIGIIIAKHEFSE